MAMIPNINAKIEHGMETIQKHHKAKDTIPNIKDTMLKPLTVFVSYLP